MNITWKREDDIELESMNLFWTLNNKYIFTVKTKYGLSILKQMKIQLRYENDKTLLLSISILWNI